MLKLMYITNSPEVASIADGRELTEYLSTSEQYGKERSARKTGIP